MQQPLERYGVVVLLFLVALVAVAVFWEDGSSTHAANESLATVEPFDERAPVDGPERRPLPDTSRVAANRPAPEISLRPESDGVDQRGRTTTYGVPPVVDDAASLVDNGQPDPGDAGFSRPEARGGGSVEPSGGGAVRADLVDGRPSAQDPLAKDLSRLPGTAATPAPAATPPAGAAREYTVRSGESLWRIAERELGNGTRCKEIAALNGLSNSDHIVAGMTLRMPAKDAPAPAKPTPNAAAPGKAAPDGAEPLKPAAQPVRRGTGDTTERLAQTPGTRRYLVKSGDSLGLIAQRELGSVKRSKDIMQLNGMSDEVVRLGTTLLLPGESAVIDGGAVASLTPKPEARREAPRPAARPAAGNARRASGGEFIVR